MRVARELGLETAFSKQGHYSHTDNEPDLPAFTESWKRDLRDHKWSLDAKDGKGQWKLPSKVREYDQKGH
jgi:hypothetical protein